MEYEDDSVNVWEDTIIVSNNYDRDDKRNNIVTIRNDLESVNQYTGDSFTEYNDSNEIVTTNTSDGYTEDYQMMIVVIVLVTVIVILIVCIVWILYNNYQYVQYTNDSKYHYTDYYYQHTASTNITLST